VTKARADTLRSKAVDRIDRLEADRQRRPIVDVVFAIREEDEVMGGRELAAAVAYRLFFLSLPLMLIFVGGLGLTGASDRGSAEDVVRSSGTTAAVAQSIATATAELSVFEHLVVLGIGVFGTYFAARGLMKTLARINAGAWRVPMAKPANALRAVGIVLGIVTALVLLSHEWNQIRDRLGVLEFLGALPIVGAIYGALFVVLLAQLPRPAEAAWSRLVPGALFVGLVIASLQAFVLGYIAHKLSSSSELYGGVGTAIVVLFWLYLIGRVLVLGPILDGVLWRRRPPAVAEEA
jgi:uncharacterized BrkB/YihY/UPF0761 family membrane protein